MTADQPLTLSAGERAEAVAAVYDRLFETRRYLTASDFTSGHDDCCPTARARAARTAEQRRDLEQREATVLSLLNKLGETP